MPSGDYGELGGNLPVVSPLNSSFSTSLSLPSPYLFVPPAARKTISDVRRTFCLFVTFDLLFISLLWIIELNVSFRLRMCFFCRRAQVRVAEICLFYQISNSLKEGLNHEVVHYDYRSSFFDIFVSASVLMNKQLCDLKHLRK